MRFPFPMKFSTMCQVLFRFLCTMIVFYISDVHNLRASDTLLISMQSKPFFYNVITSGNGQIYAGTSDGVYELKRDELHKINEEKGYITVDQDEKIIIHPDGIKNYEERKLLYLLPYPEKGREEYHAQSDDHLYIVSNGILYTFEFTPYTVSYQNISIRTMSEHWVGSYSGVFYKGKKIDFPRFCDYYMREYNDLAFLCYSGLIIFKMPSSATDTTLTEVKISCLSQIPIQYVYDVYYSTSENMYYVAANGKLIQMNKEMSSAKELYQFPGEQIHLLGETRNSLFFAANNVLLTRNIEKQIIDTVAQVDDRILSGCVTLKNYYLLTSRGLHVIYSDGTQRKLATLNKAHTLLAVSPSEFLIGTDLGLFYFNTANNALSAVIEGVEFNSKALYLENNIVHAGSINGIYSFPVNAILKIIAKNTESKGKIATFPTYYILVLAIALMIIILLVRWLTQLKKKLQESKEQLEKISEPVVNREQIEEYIRQNLTTASISSINDHFNTNATYVYSLFEPDKPGSIIQQQRMQMVAEMRKNGAKIGEISVATGLSESYIRKLKV